MRFRDEDDELDPTTDDSARARRMRDKARGRAVRQARNAKGVTMTADAAEVFATVARTLREARRSVRRGS